MPKAKAEHAPVGYWRDYEFGCFIGRQVHVEQKAVGEESQHQSQRRAARTAAESPPSLANDAATRRADREADRDLPFPSRGARQHQIADWPREQKDGCRERRSESRVDAAYSCPASCRSRKNLDPNCGGIAGDLHR